MNSVHVRSKATKEQVYDVVVCWHYYNKCTDQW